MFAQVERQKVNKSRAETNSVAQNKRNGRRGFGKVGVCKDMRGLSSKPDNIAIQKETVNKASSPEQNFNSPRVTQLALKVDGTQLSREGLEELVNRLPKQDLIEKWWKTDMKEKNIKNFPCKELLEQLMNLYELLDLNMNTKNDAMTQIIQDTILLMDKVGKHKNELKSVAPGLAGTPHMKNEFRITSKVDKDKIVEKMDSVKGGDEKAQRLYRNMSYNEYVNGQLSGHAGSFGQAYYYFRKDKLKGRDAVLVEFSIPDSNIDQLVSKVGTESEGVQTTNVKFGGKTEDNSMFNEKNTGDRIFSVNLVNAQALLQSKNAEKRVLATVLYHDDLDAPGVDMPPPELIQI